MPYCSYEVSLGKELHHKVDSVPSYSYLPKSKRCVREHCDSVHDAKI